MTPKPKLDLEDLKKKALAATQGKWFAAKNNRGFGVRVQSAWISAFGMGEGDAAYIAAVSPDVILDLIERLEGMEEALTFIFEKCSVASDPCANPVAWEALKKWGTK